MKSTCVADVGDQLIEVVGLENTMHMAQVKGGIQSGRRLAQCAVVVIRLSVCLSVTVDLYRALSQTHLRCTIPLPISRR